MPASLLPPNAPGHGGLSKLIETSRAVRRRLSERARSPMIRISPGLAEELQLIERLLVELENLDDRVTLIEVAYGLAARKNAVG